MRQGVGADSNHLRLPPLEEREHLYGGRVWRARLSHPGLSNICCGAGSDARMWGMSISRIIIERVRACKNADREI